MKTLADNYDAEMLVITQPGKEIAPYSSEEFNWIKNYVVYQDATNYPYLQRLVSEFQPDSILMCSWNFRDYMKLTRSEPFKRLPRISGMDNQWLGTVKQYIGVIVSPVFLKPSIDCFFVPGDRQVEFCRRLGYNRNKIAMGYYSCDVHRFSEVNHWRKGLPLPKSFLFVGRMVPDKGISVLAEAYQLYRKQVSEPYSLICVGTGLLDKSLLEINGIDLKGFVQPTRLLEIFAKASCLLLPSLFEPWGVVVHEATTAGLAVICTHSCGAGVHLVQDDYNGYIVQPGKPKDLASAMIDYSRKTDFERATMSKNSRALSRQFTPERWALSLKKAIERVRAQKQCNS
jgi:glycosyltransferase involved in cell wall biosynthesis